MSHENIVAICGVLVLCTATSLIFSQPITTFPNNKQIWGPGLDVILLIDVSLSSAPQSDTDHLSTYRTAFAEGIVNNLKTFSNNSIGDRLAVIAFADSAVQVFPENGSYGVIGFYPALLKHVKEHYHDCISGKHRQLASLNRRKTNLIAALQFTQGKIKRDRALMEGAERDRSVLVVLISDGIQDNTNESDGNRSDLVDHDVIARSINNLLLQDPRVRMVFFHQPCKWKDINTSEYALTQQWTKVCNALSETYRGRLQYFAADTILGAQNIIHRALMNSRWADTTPIYVQIEAPFKLIGHGSFYSLYGKVTFTVPELAVDYLWVSIETETFKVNDNQLQSFSYEEIVLPSLRDRRSSGNRIVSDLSLVIFRQTSNLNLPDSGERILKILPLRASLPSRGHEFVKFIQVKDSNQTVISVDNNPEIALAKIEFLDDVFLSALGSILSYLPFLIIAALVIVLLKLLAGSRLYFGLVKLGWKIQYSVERKNLTKKDNDDTTEDQDNRGSPEKFNGSVKIDILDALGRMVSAPPWIKVRPLGKKHFIVEKQIVSHSSTGQAKTHTTQTFLSNNEKELSSNEFFYVLKAEPKEYVSHFKKEVEIGVHPYLQDGKGKPIFYNLKLEYFPVTGAIAKLQRIFSSWFDYEGAMCPIEKFICFWGILTAVAIVWQRACDPLVFELHPADFYIKAVFVLLCIVPIGILKPGYLVRILFSIKTALAKG